MTHSVTEGGKMSRSEKMVSEVMAIVSENEALRAAVDELMAEKAKWFDIALTRLGDVQRMTYEISVLQNKISAAPQKAPELYVDYEAFAWALGKLRALGLHQNNEYNANMVDRLEAMQMEFPATKEQG